MNDIGYSFYNSFANYPIIKPNRITGEGRKKFRPLIRHRTGDLKKKQHRKMAKASRRKNRR